MKNTRNKSVKDITNFKSNVDLFEKSNVNNIEQRFLTKNDKKNNYLLLTSLYNINLPKIEKKKNLSIRKKFNFGETINNENSFLQNISQYDNKVILNESLSSTNNKKKFNTIDLLYNYHEKKIKNRQKKKIKKLYILSSLNSLISFRILAFPPAEIHFISFEIIFLKNSYPALVSSTTTVSERPFRISSFMLYNR